MFNQEFHDREEAGILLAEKLKQYKNRADALVLAVPRGGIPVGYEIAKHLEIPLDIAFSKKIGHPLNKEFAIGSVSLDSVFLDEIEDVPQNYVEKEIIRIREDLKEKRKLFMDDEPPLNIKDKVIILVDDGIATGNTLLATIEMLRKSKPSKIIVATPVIPRSRIDRIDVATDKLVFLIAPIHFPGVGAFYENFEQVTDAEVIRLIKELNEIKQKQ